jgi:hypothetical protein
MCSLGRVTAADQIFLETHQAAVTMPRNAGDGIRLPHPRCLTYVMAKARTHGAPQSTSRAYPWRRRFFVGLCESFGSSPFRAIRRPGISRARPLLRTFSGGGTSCSPGDGVRDAPVSSEILGSELPSDRARFAGVRLGGVDVSPLSRSFFDVPVGEGTSTGLTAPAKQCLLAGLQNLACSADRHGKCDFI